MPLTMTQCTVFDCEVEKFVEIITTLLLTVLYRKKKESRSDILSHLFVLGITFTEKWNTDNIVTVEVGADDAVGKGSKLSAVGTFSPFTG